MCLDGCCVEGLDAEAKMVHVSARSGWRSAARAAQYSIHRHQVDERAAGPELSQPDLLLFSLYFTTQHVAIEPEHLVEIDNSKDNMIDLSYLDHKNQLSQIV